MSRDMEGDKDRQLARVRRLAVLREAGYLPLIDILPSLAGEGNMEAAWLKARGRLCSGDAAAFIFPRETPLQVPKERWFSRSADDLWKTGKLVINRPALGIFDEVMNRPNLNPGAVNFGAIDANGRLKIQPITAVKGDALTGLDGSFTVFLERKACQLFAERETTTAAMAVEMKPKRRTGPKPSDMPRVLEQMRKVDPNRLDAMKIEEMMAEFDAKKTLAREARQRVLAELRTTPNSGK